MRGLWAIFAAAFILLLIASCATGTLRATDIPAPHYNCKAADAISVSTSEFAKNPRRYLGKCVRAQGIHFGTVLYADLDAMYSAGEDPQRGVTLNVNEDYFDITFDRIREYGEVVGLAYTCQEVDRRNGEAFKAEQADARKQGEILIALGEGGACRFINAPRGSAYLFVTSWRTIRGKPLSLSDQASAQKYGNLVQMSDDWPYASEVKAFAQSWFDFVRAQDQNGLASLTPYQLFAPSDSRKLVSSDRSPVRFLFGTPPRPIKYFEVKLPPVLEQGSPHLLYEALGCVCKDSDCEGRWPITDNDGDAGFWNDLPYACIVLARESDEPAGQVTVDPSFFYGLEP
jgi:hypothetical protein